MSRGIGRNKHDNKLDQELYSKWRRKVFEHDRFICQACMDWKHHLEVHHLLSYSSCPEGRIDIDNGVTLCKCCHKKFHEKYGQDSNTVEQFVEFQEQCVPFYDRGKW